MGFPRRDTAVSAVLHAAALAFLLYVPRLHVEPARLPGTTLGSHISLTYSPGRARTQSSIPAPKPVAAKVTAPAKQAAQTMAMAGTTSPASAHPNDAQGGDALGSGNVTVALATFFPTPHPDVPHGTRGDVVVDVVIDEQGKVVQFQVAHSLGDSIDQVVLATIQTWTFKPATKNGIAVPSEQELLFHYERG
jgi:protein TonB